jgi:hypothetical protein
VNSSDRSWLRADPDQLDRFAGELDELADDLERIRARLSDMASFVSPSTDPATLRAVEGLAEDGHDHPGTPVYAVARAINDMRQQALVARLAARDYRDAERTAAVRLRAASERAT